MQEKLNKKLKFYDSVVNAGETKFATDYIEYAQGYLSAFEDCMLSFVLGLKNTHSIPCTESSYTGYYKGCKDLRHWIEKENK